MKEAMYWEKKENNAVQCLLCPKRCTIKDGSVGFCSARKNVKGKLYSLVYGKPCAIHVDPIEKKPLYHFLPGSMSLSIGTFGCNLGCVWCQNWDISRGKADEHDVEEVMPEQIVDAAIKNRCESISYTYNEPTVFYEFMIETAKLAKKKGIKNIIVSNGFINKEPLAELCKYIDAANIDLKAFRNETYKKYCSAELEPVLESLRVLKEKGVWLETTTLIIPGINDDVKEIELMMGWIKENIGNVVVHFSRFHPDYKLQNVSPTSEKTLLKARETALKYVDYAYIGNISIDEGNNTCCHKCRASLIKRDWFSPSENKIKNGKCPGCGNRIIGVWE
ncbi:AmmeMemoRadiSam system radical SAM enzyme [Candidatus Woesearchaeota archaeon]|nr:AmmeMemoRadiSam system radical SAM enzyme [Candidatus Woesearchaeota archaeon]